MIDLCAFEWQILEECAGIRPPGSYGAAVNAALEVLRGDGLIDRDGDVTHKGRILLSERQENYHDDDEE